MKKELRLTKKAAIFTSVIFIFVFTVLFGGWQKTSVSVAESISIPDLQGEKAREHLKRSGLDNALSEAIQKAHVKSVEDKLKIQTNIGKLEKRNDLEPSFLQTAKLTANDAGAEVFFGNSVSISNDTAVVGSVGNENGKGAAYVFVRNGENWTRQAKLTANDGQTGDVFGFSVAISNETLIVGAPQARNDQSTKTGTAYIFERNGGIWTQKTKLFDVDGDFGDRFGTSVSISNNTAIIGAPDHNFSGAVYVASKEGAVWLLRKKLMPNDQSFNPSFGFSVSISNETAVIGAPGDEFQKGAAYIFAGSGANWTQQAKLFIPEGSFSDILGFSVSIFNETAVIGAPGESNQKGAAYIFVRSNTNWTRQAKIVPNNNQTTSGFGVSAAISNDTAIIGAALNDFGRSENAAFIFTRNGVAWAQQSKLLPNDGGNDDLFGYSTAISMNRAIVGSPENNPRGAAYIFSANNPSVSNRTKFDFDGDGKADISVFRPTSGAWYLLQSASGFSGVGFGFGTDLITPADFDGDGKTDIAVFRPENGAWYYLNSSNGTFSAIAFGQAGDIPLPADFDGDGRADINVFRPSNGAWYRLNSGSGQFSGVGFGQAGDIPLNADFDGDGKSDIAVFRPGAGAFYWLNSSSGQFSGVGFGFGTDIPTPADFDGDGKTDIAVFRPSNGVWYRINSSNGQFFGAAFGQDGDIPVAADYDGDGRADIAVFRPTNGVWYLLNSQSGFTGVQFGIASDQPIPAAFVP